MWNGHTCGSKPERQSALQFIPAFAILAVFCGN